MPLTLRWWERLYGRDGPDAKIFPISNIITSVQPTLNAAATVLRSRFFPSFTYTEQNPVVHNEVAWSRFSVMFVAWYDATSAGDIPDPDTLDSRIIATARLTPHYAPSVFSPTTSFYVVWDTNGQAVQSFGQRKPDPATLLDPRVNTAIRVDDQTGYFYTSHTNVAFEYECFSEVLFGV